MKSALIKDTFLEIKNSFGRFMSIFVIIALGCGFFSGIKATMPDMKDSAWRYFNENKLADITLKSNYGVKYEDIDSMVGLDGVKGVMPGYSKDVFYSYNGKNIILKAISYKSKSNLSGENDLNKLVLEDGRLPEKSGECVIEKKISSPDTFKIGETLKISEPDESRELSESLKHDEYKIVGIAYSPAYIGYERDKTNVGQGSVDSNIFISEEDFVSDYYTEMYVTFNGLCELEPFSDEYKKKVSMFSKKAESAFSECVNKRYLTLREQAQDRIDSLQKDAQAYERLLDSDDNTLSYLEQSLKAQMSELSPDSAEYKTAASTLDRVRMLLDARRSSNKNVLAEMENELVTARLQIASAKQQLDEMAKPQIYISDRFDSADYSSYNEDSNRVDNIAKVFPVFFIIVAALVCLTTMTRMVDEQRTQIGTYKALGYSGATIALKYIIYACIATVFGSTIGIIIGLRVFPAVIFNAYKILYNLPMVDTPFKWDYYILCTVCALAVTVSAVAVTLKSVLIHQPSQIMRPKTPPAGKRVFLEKIPFIWNRLSFLSKVTVRNLLRYKKRFLMSVIGIAGCTALVITGFGLKNSISAIADKQFKEVFLYDGAAAVNTDKLRSSEDIERSLSDYREISQYLLQSSQSFDAKANDLRQSVSVSVPQNPEELNDYISLKSVSGGKECKLSSGGAVITNKLSKLLKLKVGDSITLSNGTKTAGVRIDAIAENYAMHYVYMSPQAYKNVFGEEASFNTVLINLKGGVDNDEFASKMIASEDFLGISYLEDTGENFNDSMQSLDIIIWVLIICAAALAIVVLYNLANINITERVREIATIKVLGFYDGEVSAYIYRENAVSTAIGILLGFVLGVFLHRFVVTTAEIDLVMFDRSLVWWAFPLAAALTVLFAVVVNFVLFFKLRKIKMVESLKSVE